MNEDQKKNMIEYFRQFGREFMKLGTALAAAKKPMPEDPQLVKLQTTVAEARKPIRIDPLLVRRRNETKVSGEQLKQQRLTAAQDVGWALINSPAFLFNH